MTTTATAPAPQTTTRSEFHEDAGPYASRGQWIVLAVMGAIKAADLLLAKDTFDRAAMDTDLVSWFIALGVAGAAIFLAFSAGQQLRLKHKVAFWASAGAWFALGIGMMLLRFAPVLSGAEDGDLESALMGVFILFLYLGAGTKIMITAHEMTNPMRRQLLSAQRAEARASKRLEKLEAKLARVNNTLANWSERETALETTATKLKAEASDRGTELKHRARLEVAAILGRVEATGVYRQDLWPRGAHAPATAGTLGHERTTHR